MTYHAGFLQTQFTHLNVALCNYFSFLNLIFVFVFFVLHFFGGMCGVNYGIRLGHISTIVA